MPTGNLIVLPTAIVRRSGAKRWLTVQVTAVAGDLIVFERRNV
jgi:hypothetical protein